MRPLRRPRSPRLFRDRLLAAMLLVALVPLLSFAAVAVVDLGAMSRATADETTRTLVDAERTRQLGAVADRAKIIDLRRGAIAADITQLRDQMAARLGGTAVPPGGGFSLFRGVYWKTGSGGSSSLLAGPGAGPVNTRITPLTTAGVPEIPLLQGLVHSYPEVNAVWVSDPTNDTLLSVPALDVPAAISAGRLSPDAPAGGGDNVFTTSGAVPRSAQPRAESDQPSGAHRNDAPVFTGTYKDSRTGDVRVTVSITVSGGKLIAGADISTGPLADQALATRPGATRSGYQLLLATGDLVLGSSEGAATDYSAASLTTGAVLPGTDPQLTRGLSDAMAAQRPATLSAHLGGADKELFTTPISATHWMLVSVIPVSALAPDSAALTRGIDSAIHRLLLFAIPIGLLLMCIAFLVARGLSRRLVGPVNALRDAAERLASGDTEAGVPQQGSDEVGALADSLERMRREINGSRDVILAAARELEQRVADRTTELRSRNEELLALNDLAGSLTHSLDNDVILADALAAVRAVLPMRRGAGFIINEGRLELLAGDVGSGAEPGTASLDAVAAAAVDEQHLVQVESGGEVVAALPLGVGDGVLGALAFTVGDGADITAAGSLLRAIADQVGLALRTARLSSDGRDTAVLEERTRLAREIHDTLAQQLTAIVLQLESAEVLLPSGDERAAAVQTVVLARDLARAALHEARRSVWDLRPAPLAATGFLAALEAELTAWSARTGIAADYRAAGFTRPLALQPQAEVALLRICQEALANVEKHAAATNVKVRARIADGSLAVTVRDDGRGIKQADTQRQGAFGLIGMQERARLAGATVVVRRRRSGGTVVDVRIPLAGGPADTGSRQASLVSS